MDSRSATPFMSRRQGRPGLAHHLLPHKLYLEFGVNADDVRLLQAMCGYCSRYAVRALGMVPHDMLPGR